MYPLPPRYPEVYLSHKDIIKMPKGSFLKSKVDNDYRANHANHIIALTYGFGDRRSTN